MALEAIERVNQAEEAARGKKEQAAEQAKTLMMEAEKMGKQTVASAAAPS